MSSAVLSDAQFGVARILKPYSGFTQGYAATIVDPFTVPAPTDIPNTFDVEVGSAAQASAVGQWVTIPGVGTFLREGVSGTTVTLSNPVVDACTPWLANNQTGTFSATPYYVAGAGNYDGRPGSMPLMFSEAGKPFDENAGKPGYSAKLLRGLPVPMGSRVLVWVPKLVADPCQTPLTAGSYQWEFMFRLRSLADYSRQRSPWHLASSAPVVGEKFPVPAATHSVIYNGMEPPAGARIVTQRVLQEGFSAQDASPMLPLTPDQVSLSSLGNGDGLFEQGVRTGAPSFDILEVQCAGDELLVMLTKVSGNWELGPTDQDFLVRAFDTTVPYYGVYVMPGSAP